MAPPAGSRSRVIVESRAACRATLSDFTAGLVGLWGVSHVTPAREVVAGFEPTAVDNPRIVVQQWLAEAFTMWGPAALVIAVAGGEDVTSWVYRVVAVLLVALAVLTAT